MDIADLAASGESWPHPLPSADGGVVGLDGVDLPIPAQPHPYLARMARFVDGAEHVARRAAVAAALPDAAGLEDAAYLAALTAADGRTRLDVVAIARSIPVLVLGQVMGVGDRTAQIAALCERGEAAEHLPDIARTSLLYQCRDATAALITNALADNVDVQRASSVVLTRRAGGVWVLLEQAPFGAGAHACPGKTQALSLARGVVAAFAAYDVVERGPNEARPNIRMPSRLVLHHR